LYERQSRKNKQIMIKRIDFSKAAKKLRVNLIYELTETDEVCNEDEMYEIYENFNNMEDE
jgi:hypothetical protein